MPVEVPVGSDAEHALEREKEQGRIIDLGRPYRYSHECGYLPGRIATTEERSFAAMSPEGYVAILGAGFRRFGGTFFRPRCRGCDQCISLRVLVNQFSFTRRWRRILARNADIRAEVSPIRADPDAVSMANTFYAHRSEVKGWEKTPLTPAGYFAQFCTGPVPAQHVRFFRGDALVGVGLFDDLIDGETAVLFHYVESWKPDSPGTFNVLWLIARALERAKPHVYLGFYVPESSSTSYKGQFRPAESLRGGAWGPLI